MDFKEFVDGIDEFVRQARDIADQVTDGEVDMRADIEHIHALDYVIDTLRGMRAGDYIDEQTAWNVSVPLGVLLGEMIINAEGFSWKMGSEGIPVIDAGRGDEMSPITKIFRIIEDGQGQEGTAHLFYTTFMTIRNSDASDDVSGHEGMDKKPEQSSDLDAGALEEAIHFYNAYPGIDTLRRVLGLMTDIDLWVPFTVEMSDADMNRIETMIRESEETGSELEGTVFTNSDEIRMKPDTLKNGERLFFPAFTSIESMGEYGENFSKVETGIKDILEMAKSDSRGLSGIVINAFTEPFVISPDGWKYLQEMIDRK